MVTTAASPQRPPRGPAYKIVAGLLFVLILAAIFFDPIFKAERDYTDRERQDIAAVNRIAVMLHNYAAHHGGQYPDGATSTEVFQKLLDEGLCKDPEDFYFPLPGKVKAASGTNLKAENVSFDVIGGITANDPPGMPLVFITGYELVFTTSGPIGVMMNPDQGLEANHPSPRAVAYLGHKAAVDYVPPAVNTAGKAYHQLKP
jgi:hypothetical protein